MLTKGQVFFVTVFTQALLYGIYLATLIQCFRWLIFSDEGWKPRQRINPVMTSTIILIFLMSTINLVAALKYDLNQYIRQDQNWYKFGTVMAMDISGQLAVIAIDGILIYRCWVVYSKAWHVICVPITVWLASLACSILFLYIAGLNYGGQTYSTEMAQIGKKVLTGLYACNISITVYTTTAIIYRILSSRSNSGSNPQRLNHLMRILAESGILYTSTLIFSVVGTLLTASNNDTWVDSLISDISDPLNFSMAGITFNLILIRVYKSRVELRDSLANSKDISGDRTISGTGSNQNTTSLTEGPSSNALYEAKDEVEEDRRSRG